MTSSDNEPDNDMLRAIRTALDDDEAAKAEAPAAAPFPAPQQDCHSALTWLAGQAETIGFAGVMSGPLVRSSYRAGRLWAQAAPRGSDVDAW